MTGWVLPALLELKIVFRVASTAFVLGRPYLVGFDSLELRAVGGGGHVEGGCCGDVTSAISDNTFWGVYDDVSR